MVNWRDPALLLRDDLALTKLFHALAALYIWETVFTAGFELNVLRGKIPYRWTIWIYLGTRYTCMLGWIIFFIHDDGPRVSCQTFMRVNFAMSYISWVCASLIIVLRVIAIWNRNVIVSTIAVSSLLAGLGLNIRSLTMLESAYNPVVGACIALNTHTGLLSASAILAIDMVLLATMLIGLLRHSQRSTTGVWLLLYQQCLVWMVFAAVAEVPAVVFLILDLNDSWNQMFSGVAITILTICAARMYRSLSKHGSLTVYSSDPGQYAGGGPPVSEVPSTIRFTTNVTVSQSDGTVDERVFIPANEIPLDFVPASSDPSIAAPTKAKLKDAAGYQTAWLSQG